MPAAIFAGETPATTVTRDQLKLLHLDIAIRLNVEPSLLALGSHEHIATFPNSFRRCGGYDRKIPVAKVHDEH